VSRLLYYSNGAHNTGRQSTFTAAAESDMESRPRNDLLCVEWGVKPYTLTHSQKQIVWLLYSNMMIAVAVLAFTVLGPTCTGLSGGQGVMPTNVRRFFVLQRKQTSGCDDTKRHLSSGGFAPWCPDHGLCPIPQTLALHRPVPTGGQSWINSDAPL